MMDCRRRRSTSHAALPPSSNCRVKWQMKEWGYSALHIWNETDLTFDLFDDTTGTLQHQVAIHRNFPRM